LAYLQQIDGTVSETRNAVFIICDRVEKYVSYLQKLRPDIFGLGNRKPSPLQLTRSQANHAQQISVEEAQRWLAGGASPPCLVVDLRGPIAFRASHIPGSVNMRSDKLDEDCQFVVPFSKSLRVLFVCPTGEESMCFAAFLGE